MGPRMMGEEMRGRGILVNPLYARRRARRHGLTPALACFSGAQWQRAHRISGDPVLFVARWNPHALSGNFTRRIRFQFLREEEQNVST